MAEPVAERLGSALDVIVVRKVGAPGQPEFGIGAVSEELDGALLSEDAARLGVSTADLQSAIDAQKEEVKRRVTAYRNDRPLTSVKGCDVVLVDDGLATGVTAQAAAMALSGLGAHRVILATPVCAPETARRLSTVVDEVVCLAQPQPFGAVGAWYGEFEQTSDQEVVDILAKFPPHHSAD